jgi:hypothetical protein
MLSFSAKLVSDNRDVLHEFIVAFTVENNKFTVTEKVIPNSTNSDTFLSNDFLASLWIQLFIFPM